MAFIKGRISGIYYNKKMKMHINCVLQHKHNTEERAK